MAFFKVSTSEENIRDNSGNSNYLNKSGIYEIVIKNIIVDSTPKGSQFINLWIEYNNQPQMIYQAIRLTNNDGGASFEQALFNKLAIVAGATENTEISDPVSTMIPCGKGGEKKECMVLEDFNDTPIIIRLQMEYSLYNGNIQEKKHIRNFFRVTDKATASEIVNNKDLGKQYEKEEGYAENTQYKDDLTEEDIKNWKSNNRSGGVTKSDDKPSFGTRRSFGKK